MTFAFAAAGTGGHVYPALAVADELVASGVPGEDIVFFGGDRMEASTIPAAGYRFVQVDIRGLRRSLSLSNLSLPFVVRTASRFIASELDRAGARVLLAMGGYVSVPAAWAARRRGVRLLLHEQNAVPGLANRLIARWAETSFVAFPAAATRLPASHVVGNPLRRAFVEFDRQSRRSPGRARYDLPDDVVVLGVMGGSLGAQVLNDTVPRIAAQVDPEKVAIVHLTGATHHETVREAARTSAVRWRTVPFERHMEDFYAAADVVLARAGALTVSELAATGTPSVLVPLSAVAQEGNARHLVDAGAAIAVPQAEVDRVPAEIIALVEDESRRTAMAAAASARARPQAAAEVATALREAVR